MIFYWDRSIAPIVWRNRTPGRDRQKAGEIGAMRPTFRYISFGFALHNLHTTTQTERAMTHCVDAEQGGSTLWKRETAARNHVAHVNGHFRVSWRVQHVGEQSWTRFPIIPKRHRIIMILISAINSRRERAARAKDIRLNIACAYDGVSWVRMKSDVFIRKINHHEIILLMHFFMYVK